MGCVGDQKKHMLPWRAPAGANSRRGRWHARCLSVAWNWLYPLTPWRWLGCWVNRQRVELMCVICNHHQKHIGESIFWTTLLYNDDIWCRIPKKEISLQICGLTLCPSVCHRAAHVVICKIPILGNSSALTDWVGRESIMTDMPLYLLLFWRGKRTLCSCQSG